MANACPHTRLHARLKCMLPYMEVHLPVNMSARISVHMSTCMSLHKHVSAQAHTHATHVYRGRGTLTSSLSWQHLSNPTRKDATQASYANPTHSTQHACTHTTCHKAANAAWMVTGFVAQTDISLFGGHDTFAGWRRNRRRHACLYTCPHTCLRTRVNTCLHTCRRTCLHTCRHTGLHTCLHTSLFRGKGSKPDAQTRLTAVGRPKRHTAHRRADADRAGQSKRAAGLVSGS